MNRWLAVLGAMCLYAGSGLAATAVKQLQWEDLVPPILPGQYNKPPIGGFGNLGNFGDSSAREPVAPAPVVLELNGQDARIAGFIVPLDGDDVSSVTEFFLVPYFGACIHVPPPPANQIVFVRLAEPYKLPEGTRNPYWIEGTLHTEQIDTDIGAAGYTMKVRSIEPYTGR